MCCVYQEPAINYFDILFKSATVLIAACNVFFAIWIFRNKDKKDSADKEKDRKIQWFKVLVLDHNLKQFYLFFDNLEGELATLKTNNLTQPQKETIEGKVADLFIFLRRKFTDTLLAVDKQLYEKILSHSDELQASLSSSIFDGGINLSHQPKYDELISEKLAEAKTNIINILFSYRG